MWLLLSSFQTGKNRSTRLRRDSVSTGDFSGTQFASAGLREKDQFCKEKLRRGGQGWTDYSLYWKEQ
ncbi:hypothetical protein ILYODFUR_031010 [Ilyodon furcidens]|uniref:Uncharacterized protein n=1 Tax=Ilyodon furcidens TaxID=33524 RepID=A0ABV0U9X0_9TELE